MTENSLFDNYKGSIEDLFFSERKYTFLVGAGFHSNRTKLIH